MTNMIFLLSNYVTHRKRSTSVKHMEGADTVHAIQELFAHQSVSDTFCFAHYVQDCPCQSAALSNLYFKALFLVIFRLNTLTCIKRLEDSLYHTLMSTSNQCLQ